MLQMKGCRDPQTIPDLECHPGGDEKTRILGGGWNQGMFYFFQ